MGSILGIKFREYGQLYYFEKSDFEVAIGDKVIVKTDQGQGLGEIVSLRDDLPDDAETDELKPVHRLAVDEDFARHEENESLAREAHQFCADCIRSRKLDMKLVDVEVFFDRSKIVFYFTAPSRIDFRELVKDLVKTYRTRIELRQIGVRHETQMIGAVGNCGMVCCCRQFLRTFAPVTIKMAKEQNLFLNPAKISGICGRLLCCLSYEQDNYEEFHRACPKLGKKYQTEDGSVKVLRANMFRNSVAVLTESNEEKEYTLEEWEELSPSRPDQARQDAARAAAKRAARSAHSHEADGDSGDTEAISSGEPGGSESGVAVSKEQPAPHHESAGASVPALSPSRPPMRISDVHSGPAATPAAAVIEGTDRTGEEGAQAGDASSTFSDGVNGEAVAASLPTDVTAEASKVEHASEPAQGAPRESAASAESGGAQGEQGKPAKDERPPLRRLVKNADPAARRTSRGRRKRKRKPASGDE